MQSPRHENRRSLTYRKFLQRLADTSTLSEWEAEQAAVTCLCALEQRLQSTEARQLEAQLPLKLKELLAGCARENRRPQREMDKIALLQTVARSMNVEDWEAEPIVRAVFSAVQEHISKGEARDVASQLPKDLAALWNGVETPPVSPDQFGAHDRRRSDGGFNPPTVPGVNSPITGIESSDR